MSGSGTGGNGSTGAGKGGAGGFQQRIGGKMAGSGPQVLLVAERLEIVGRLLCISK